MVLPRTVSTPYVVYMQYCEYGVVFSTRVVAEADYWEIIGKSCSGKVVEW